MQSQLLRKLILHNNTVSSHNIIKSKPKYVNKHIILIYQITHHRTHCYIKETKYLHYLVKNDAYKEFFSEIMYHRNGLPTIKYLYDIKRLKEIYTYANNNNCFFKETNPELVKYFCEVIKINSTFICFSDICLFCDIKIIKYLYKVIIQNVSTVGIYKFVAMRNQNDIIKIVTFLHKKK